MCGACGSGVVRAPWEVELAGGAAADLRRRADVASALTEGRVRVRPWGPAGYLLQPRTAPVQAVASLEALAAALHRHLRPGLPDCPSCAARSHRLHHRPAGSGTTCSGWPCGSRSCGPEPGRAGRGAGARRLAGGGAHRTARRRARRGPRVVRAHRAPDRPGGRRRTRVGAGVAELGSRARANPSPGTLSEVRGAVARRVGLAGQDLLRRLDRGVRRALPGGLARRPASTLGDDGAGDRGRRAAGPRRAAVDAQRAWAAAPYTERAAVLRRAGDLWHAATRRRSPAG